MDKHTILGTHKAITCENNPTIGLRNSSHSSSATPLMIAEGRKTLLLVVRCHPFSSYLRGVVWPFFIWYVPFATLVKFGISWCNSRMKLLKIGQFVWPGKWAGGPWVRREKDVGDKKCLPIFLIFLASPSDLHRKERRKSHSK